MNKISKGRLADAFERAERQSDVRIIHLHGQFTWKSLLSRLGDTAVEEGFARPGISEALIERESSYPTGIDAGIGVAIPHADKIYTSRETVFVAILEEPVLFNQMGGGESVSVRIVFMLVLGSVGKHLDMMGAVADLIQDTDKLKALWKDGAYQVLTDALCRQPCRPDIPD